MTNESKIDLMLSNQRLIQRALVTLLYDMQKPNNAMTARLYAAMKRIDEVIGAEAPYQRQNGNGPHNRDTLSDFG